MKQSRYIGIFDRLASAISYLTLGWGGMIVLVILYFAKKSVSKFLRYNIFQSIFIALLFFVLAAVIGLVVRIMSYIPFLNYLAAQIVFLFNRPFFGAYSLVQTFTTGLLFYMTGLSIMGRIPRIWWVSRIIDYTVR